MVIIQSKSHLKRGKHFIFYLNTHNFCFAGNGHILNSVGWTFDSPKRDCSVTEQGLCGWGRAAEQSHRCAFTLPLRDTGDTSGKGLQGRGMCGVSQLLCAYG